MIELINRRFKLKPFIRVKWMVTWLDFISDHAYIFNFDLGSFMLCSIFSQGLRYMIHTFGFSAHFLILKLRTIA